MIYYDEYADVPAETVDAFIRTQELGRLVTVGADGTPHVGLYPFVFAGEGVELHLNRADEQLADLRASPRCSFSVDEVLATIPSHWIDREDAIFATAYHRTVVLECAATIVTDPDALAAQQVRLMSRYQPEGGFRPVASADPLYAGNLARIAAIQLRTLRRRVKWKLGQNRAPEVRSDVARRLRERGRPNDGRAADALLWTVERDRRR